MKLNVPYHSQKNNKLFPSSTCGTTCVAMILSYLSDIEKKQYTKDDDEVFVAINSKPMIEKCKNYIKRGEKWMEPYLAKRKGSNLTFINNLTIMLAEVGTYLTNNDYIFKMEYRSFGEIKKILGEEKVPLITSGNFTASGHYVCIVGYDETDGNLIYHDPYGIYPNYKTQENGEFVEYDTKILINGKIYRKGNSLSNDGLKLLTIKPEKKKG